MNIADSTVTDFQTDGVVVLRGVFRDWVEPLSQGVAEVMAHPSPLERSYQPKDGSDDASGGGGRNQARDFHGETRSNETHASSTDPEAKLYKKSAGTTAKLCYMGHAVSENRHGLVVEVQVSEASGTAERSSALHFRGEPADNPDCLPGRRPSRFRE